MKLTVYYLIDNHKAIFTVTGFCDVIPMWTTSALLGHWYFNWSCHYL